MVRPRALLQLVRVPNLFTAAADVLAGFLFVGMGWGQARALAILLVASVCFYASGVVLNDVFDAVRDLRERPGRPIPSGAIARREAAVLGAFLLVGGCALCATVSQSAGCLGLALAVCILMYDGVFKRTPAGPAMMGLCRALNLLLGMSIATRWPTAGGLYCAFLMAWYVTSVTVFARFEAGGGSARRLGVGLAGLAGAVIGLVGVQTFLDHADPWYLLLVGVLLGQVMVPGWRAAGTRTPEDVQHAVRVFVLSIILFDGCLVFAARGPLAAAMVVVLLVPSIISGRSFAVT